jgi:molybdate-binding protein
LEYDFVIPEKFLKTEKIQGFLEVLRAVSLKRYEGTGRYG